MTRHDDNDFLSRLTAPMLSQLKRIAAVARGECSLDELKAEAWIAAQTWRKTHGTDIPPEDMRLQASVLHGLWQAFGRFANRTMRNAFRLDIDDTRQDGERSMNAVAAALAAPETYEPEKALEQIQDEDNIGRCLTARFTEAVAWLRTLEHFDHDLPTIAKYLSISGGALKQRIRNAEICARCQPSMFDGITAIPDDFLPIDALPRSRRSACRAMRRICSRARPWQMHLFLVTGRIFDR